MRIALMMMVLLGCGSGVAQVKTAKDAEYKAPASTIFELAKTVAEETYTIGESDPAGLEFATAPQMYSREGGRQSSGPDDFVTTTPGSVQLVLVVKVSDVGLKRVAVTITPRALQMVIGSPMPRELAADDPEMPPWVGGRIDSLSLAIYERAKQYIEKP